MVEKRWWCEENIHTADTEQLITYLSNTSVCHKESPWMCFHWKSLGAGILSCFQGNINADTFCQGAGGENAPQGGNVIEVRFTPCGGVKVVLQWLWVHCATGIRYVNRAKSWICKKTDTKWLHIEKVKTLMFSWGVYNKAEQGGFVELWFLCQLTSWLINVHEDHFIIGCQNGVELLMTNRGQLGHVPGLTMVHWHVDRSQSPLQYRGGVEDVANSCCKHSSHQSWQCCFWSSSLKWKMLLKYVIATKPNNNHIILNQADHTDCNKGCFSHEQLIMQSWPLTLPVITDAKRNFPPSPKE